MTSLIPRTELFRILEGGWPFGEQHAVRIEHYRDNGNYVVRAELPGMDPEKDIKVTVEGTELAITAERTVDTKDNNHSEFFYGSFARTVRLPAGADTKKVTASYDAGILQVTVPVHAPVDARKVPVHITKH